MISGFSLANSLDLIGNGILLGIDIGFRLVPEHLLMLFDLTLGIQLLLAFRFSSGLGSGLGLCGSLGFRGELLALAERADSTMIRTISRIRITAPIPISSS